MPYDGTWPLEFAAEADRIERGARIAAQARARRKHRRPRPLRKTRDRHSRRPARQRLRREGSWQRSDSSDTSTKAHTASRAKLLPRGLAANAPRASGKLVEPLWRDSCCSVTISRAHPEIAREYETIKRELAAMYLQDKEQYTDAKGPFIRSIVRRAKEGFETIEQ